MPHQEMTDEAFVDDRGLDVEEPYVDSAAEDQRRICGYCGRAAMCRSECHCGFAAQAYDGDDVRAMMDEHKHPQPWFAAVLGEVFSFWGLLIIGLVCLALVEIFGRR
jgi:hypothetical protein